MPDYELHTVLPKVQNARFNFTLYKGKSENQVLITQKKPTSKLIAEIDQKIGGATRVTKGVCFFENGEFVFATKAEVAPTWEPITTKILKEHQCSKYLPVVYRKLAENETDEVEGAEGEAPGTPDGSPPPPPNGEQPVPPTATTPNGEVPPPPPVPPSPEVEKIRQSGLAVWAKLKTVLTDHPELRGEFGPLVANFNAALHAGNAAAAKEALVAVLLKLKAHGDPTASSTTTPPPVAKATGPNVLYTQSRLQWLQTRQKIQQELRKLEDSIISTSADEPDLDEISAGTASLYTMLETLDERLEDKLDAALNAEAPEKRQALHGEAQQIVKEYLAYVQSDPLIQDIDDNGFIGVAVRSSLTETLQDLSQKLNAPLQP